MYILYEINYLISFRKRWYEYTQKMINSSTELSKSVRFTLPTEECFHLLRQNIELISIAA